eukprot:NODE_147_length_15617_cov_0.576750.p10 type:complete len:269 gc:universal NODE_147_length_15617_cov_0.576750:3873-4679(+)
MIVKYRIIEEYLKLKNEITVLSKLNHPNIIKLIKFHLPPLNSELKLPKDDQVIYYTMPYYKYDLNRMDTEFKDQKEQKKRLLAIFDLWSSYNQEIKDQIRIYLNIIHQMLLAMKYLKSKGIAHRDINPENILIDDENNAILSDFGYATTDLLCDTHTGKFIYAAPEVQKCFRSKCEYNPQQSDLYSFGVTVHQILNIELDTHFIENIDIVKCTNFTKSERIKRYKLLSHSNPIIAMKSMVHLLIQCDPFKRPTPAILLSKIRFFQFMF